MSSGRKGKFLSPEKAAASFWSRVKKTPSCWEYFGSKVNSGYGQMMVRGRHMLAHRYSYELHFGIFDQKFLVLHKCDNRVCVNPDHLYLGNHRDNAIDKFNRNRQGIPRQPRGEEHWFSKLNREKVIFIRENAKLGRGKRITQPELSRMFGVCVSTIAYVVQNKIWRSV